jgi:hypothetical protein
VSNLVPYNRGGGFLAQRQDRKTGNEIARVRRFGMSVEAAQITRAEVVASVSRAAIEEFGDIALSAETVAARTPGFTPEVVDLAREGARGLKHVIRDTTAMW